jgi:hypothetical protein
MRRSWLPLTLVLIHAALVVLVGVCVAVSAHSDAEMA